MQQKLERCEYHRLKDFTADITQIFENARTYNPKDSAIYQCADILEKQFRERILQTKAEMEMRNKEQTTVSGFVELWNSYLLQLLAILWRSLVPLLSH